MRFLHLLLLGCALAVTGCQREQVVGTVTGIENKVVGSNGGYKAIQVVTVEDQSGNIHQLADVENTDYVSRWETGQPYIFTLSSADDKHTQVGKYRVIKRFQNVEGYEFEIDKDEESADEEDEEDEEDIGIDLSGEIKNINDSLKELRQELSEVKSERD